MSKLLFSLICAFVFLKVLPTEAFAQNRNPQVFRNRSINQNNNVVSIRLFQLASGEYTGSALHSPLKEEIEAKLFQINELKNKLKLLTSGYTASNY